MAKCHGEIISVTPGLAFLPHCLRLNTQEATAIKLQTKATGNFFVLKELKMPFKRAAGMVDAEGETRNQLFQILEEWNIILPGASVDLSVTC